MSTDPDPTAARVVEHAVLQVRAGTEASFEVAFARARPLITAQVGFRGLRLLHHFYDPFPVVEHATAVLA